MRRFVLIIVAVLTLAIMTSCKTGGTSPEPELGGKTYVWEKEGFPDEFTITLEKDGTYQYYEGAFSSYIGSGKWTFEDGIVTLTEDEINGYDSVFRFAAKDGALVYISEGSDKFTYVTVEDGDKFLPSDDADPFYLR